MHEDGLKLNGPKKIGKTTVHPGFKPISAETCTFIQYSPHCSRVKLSFSHTLLLVACQYAPVDCQCSPGNVGCIDDHLVDLWVEAVLQNKQTQKKKILQKCFTTGALQFSIETVFTSLLTLRSTG